MAATDGLTSRKAALAERISLLALEKPYWPTVARLRCFRGVDWLTALSIHLELSADWARFQRATRLGCWLGLTPSRSQSGESDQQGSITKTGSGLARRLLIEAAWQYARPPRIGERLASRQQGQPDDVDPSDRRDRAQYRVHRVYTRMRSRGKPNNVIAVACARELSCFLWAAAIAP